MRDRGLEVLVDNQLAAAVGLQANRFQIELVAVGLPSDRVEQGRAVNGLATLQLGKNAIAVVVKTHLNDFFTQTKHGSQLAKLEAETLHHLAIDKVQQCGTLIEQRDLHPQRREHGSIFQSDDAGAHDDQLARQLLQLVYLVGIEDAFAVDGDVGAVRRPCTTSEDKIVAAQQGVSVVAGDLHAMRVEKAGIAFVDHDAIAPELRLDDLDLARHDGIGAKNEVLHGDGFL